MVSLDGFLSFQYRLTNSDTTPIDNLTNATLLDGLWGQEWQKSMILLTCCLSMFGSALIIASWVLFSDLRGRTRHILVCLSIADFGVALANGVGVIYHDHVTVCKVQAGLAAFSASSSFLWTLTLATYLFSTVVMQYSPAKHSMKVLHIINWGIPLAVMSSAAGLGILGGDPGAATAWQGWWCCLRSDITKTEAIMYVLFISEVWAYLSYLLVPIFFLVTRHYIKKEAKHFRTKFLTAGSMNAAQSVDRKLAILPMVFILLHVWTSVLCVEQLLHILRSDSTNYDPTHVPYQILHFLQGIGDSAQGFANAVLFCVLTKKVRSNFAQLFRGLACCRRLAVWRQSRRSHDDDESVKSRFLHTPPPGDSIQSDLANAESRAGEQQPLLTKLK